MKPRKKHGMFVKTVIQHLKLLLIVTLGLSDLAIKYKIQLGVVVQICYSSTWGVVKSNNHVHQGKSRIIATLPQSHKIAPSKKIHPPNQKQTMKTQPKQWGWGNKTNQKKNQLNFNTGLVKYRASYFRHLTASLLTFQPRTWTPIVEGKN